MPLLYLTILRPRKYFRSPKSFTLNVLSKYWVTCLISKMEFLTKMISQTHNDNLLEIWCSFVPSRSSNTFSIFFRLIMRILIVDIIIDIYWFKKIIEVINMLIILHIGVTTLNVKKHMFIKIHVSRKTSFSISNVKNNITFCANLVSKKHTLFSSWI